MIRLPGASIVKAVDVSTAHITRRDAELMSNDCMVVPRCQSHEYGFTIFVGVDLKCGAREDLIEAGLSAALIDLVEAAQRQKALLLNLDRDATVFPKLPRFDW